MENTNTTDFEIDEDIKKSATQCEKNVACLSDNNYKLCEVTRTASNNVFFIECRAGVHCSYRKSFGFSAYLCSCPIRKEIYRKYKI